MKVIENGHSSIENTLVNSLSERDLSAINGGWCVILICGLNFSAALLDLYTSKNSNSVLAKINTKITIIFA